MSGNTDRTFILVDGYGNEHRSTRAECYALEMSEMIRPTTSTDKVWRFTPAPGMTWDDIEYALRAFRRPRED